MKPHPLKHYRKDFPLLKRVTNGKPLVYLDSAATAQKPQTVIDTMSHFYESQYGTVHRAVYELSSFATGKYEETRGKVRALLNGAKNEEFIFTRGTTESINLIAYSFGKAFISPGDEILISEMEHHSNIVPWQLLCEDRGAILKVIPVNELGELDLSSYEKLLSEKTKLVAVNHISNVLGTINPIKKMIERAHFFGAKFLVDGAQSAPHMPVNVQDLDADFYVFSGHKFYGPTGIGVLYGKEELLNQMPPYQGGGDMIQRVTFEKTSYNELPLKFEAGTPMIAEVLGLGAAIDYIQGIGLENICLYEENLLNKALSKMESIDCLNILGKASHRGAIITFAIDGVHPLDLAHFLDLEGIAIRTGHLCAQPLMARFGLTSASRASFSFYNNEEEIDYFVTTLQNTIKKIVA